MNTSYLHVTFKPVSKPVAADFSLRLHRLENLCHRFCLFDGTWVYKYPASLAGRGPVRPDIPSRHIPEALVWGPARGCDRVIHDTFRCFRKAREGLDSL
jgi:hypothetical protein